MRDDYNQVRLKTGFLNHTSRNHAENDIPLTGSFSFGNISAVFIRDPDRNVVELDVYRFAEDDETGEYASHL